MDIGQIIISVVVLVFSVVVHEVAHGWTALKLGDTTARDAGRLTLNPIPHIDPMGSILLPLVLVAIGSPFLFGSAKPVPVRVNLLNDPENDHPKVAAAGPISNLLMALVSALALGLLKIVAILMQNAGHFGFMESGSPWYFLVTVFNMGILINVVLALFNMVPLPPLDGSWILARFLPPEARVRYFSLRRFGFLPFLLLLMVLNYTFVGNIFRQILYAIVGFYFGIANNLVGLFT